MLDDKTLIKKFLAGDDESFEELIIKYRANAISFAIRYIKDYHFAEDIVQESFATIYVYKERYNNKYPFKTYLFTIIRNKAIDKLRKLKKINNQPYEFKLYRSPEDIVIEQEQTCVIMQKFSELKEEYQTVLYLSQYENLKQKEIAKVMNKSVAQIKVLNYRAKKKLQKLCEKEAIR